MAPHKPYPAEQLDWLVQSINEMKAGGAAGSSEEAAEALAAEFSQRVGRPVEGRTVLSTYFRARKRLVEPPTAREQEVQAAGYLLIIPQGTGKHNEYRFARTANEAQEALEEVVRANRGFFPEGLKLFGEIVIETHVSVNFKHRSMAAWSPGAIRSAEVKVRAGA